MVIKLASIEGKPCVKISDDLMKVSSSSLCTPFRTRSLWMRVFVVIADRSTLQNTGDKETVLKVKDIFGLPK